MRSRTPSESSPNPMSSACSLKSGTISPRHTPSQSRRRRSQRRRKGRRALGASFTMDTLLQSPDQSIPAFSPLPHASAVRWAGAADAVKVVQSGQRVYIGGGCGIPVVLAGELARRAPELRDVEIIHVLTAGTSAWVTPEASSAFRDNSLFIGPNVRTAVQQGRADFTPVFLSEIPRLFREGHLPIDVALISVSPPDPHGYCSYGVEVGVTKPAVESARVVIAEINPRMPRVWGNSFIHVSQIDYCVEVDYPLPELRQGDPAPIYSRIGRHIADL